MIREQPNASAVRVVTVVVGAAFAALALPVVIAAGVRPDANAGDLALIELRIRDVFSSDSPLVGAYSRYGWSHPGPFMFELFAVPYRMLGNDATALRLTTLLFNAAVLAAIVWLLRRRGAAALAAIGGAVGLLIWGLRPDALSEGWNVTVANLPFALAIVACWCALCDDRCALLTAALAASFVFQAHVGAGVALGPLFVVTVAVVLRRAVRDGIDARRWALGAAVVGVTIVAMLVDVVARWPGNLGELVRWSFDNDEPKVGATESFRLIGRATSLSFPFHPQVPNRFLLEIETIDVGVVPGILLVLLGAAGWLSWRRRWIAERTLCLVLGLSWVSALVAVATITRPLGWWLVDWLQPLAWLTWGAVVLVGWRWLQARFSVSISHRRVVAVVTAAAALIGVFAMVDHAREVRADDERIADTVEPVSDLSSAAEAFVTEGELVRLDHAGGPLLADATLSGVANQLDAAGREVCVDATLAYKLRPERTCPDAGVDRYLVVRREVVTGDPPIGPDGEPMQLLAEYDPLTAAERAEADALTAELTAILEADGRDEQIGALATHLADAVVEGDDASRLADLRAVPGVRYALYGL